METEINVMDILSGLPMAVCLKLSPVGSLVLQATPDSASKFILEHNGLIRREVREPIKCSVQLIFQEMVREVMSDIFQRRFYGFRRITNGIATEREVTTLKSKF